jgi:hypothetical protein
MTYNEQLIYLKYEVHLPLFCSMKMCQLLKWTKSNFTSWKYNSELLPVLIYFSKEFMFLTILVCVKVVSVVYLVEYDTIPDTGNHTI